MQIDETELEYDETEAVCLDRYLGGSGECKCTWAQRVWASCYEYANTNGAGNDGNGMSSVFARDPRSIWEEKKRLRRAALVREMHNTVMPPEYLDVGNIEKDIKNNVKPVWKFAFADGEVMKLKDDPRYKTRDQGYAEELAKVSKIVAVETDGARV